MYSYLKIEGWEPTQFLSESSEPFRKLYYIETQYRTRPQKIGMDSLPVEPLVNGLIQLQRLGVAVDRRDRLQKDAPCV